MLFSLLVLAKRGHKLEATTTILTRMSQVNLLITQIMVSSVHIHSDNNFSRIHKYVITKQKTYVYMCTLSLIIFFLFSNLEKWKILNIKLWAHNLSTSAEFSGKNLTLCKVSSKYKNLITKISLYILAMLTKGQMKNKIWL